MSGGSGTFMDKVRSFFGYHIDPPKNEFRNPIWGSDDDDDDGDELFTRQHQVDVNLDMNAHMDLHQEITRHMQDIFSSFGGIFGDVKTFFSDDFGSFFGSNPPLEFDDTPQAHIEPDGINSNRIREYYLKPGYNQRLEEPKDVDLDGKISSKEISGLLNKHEDSSTNTPHFDGNVIPGRSYCKTIITTSITKPDGTVETRKIIKNGNEVIEETTTSLGPNSPGNPGLANISSTGILLSELASLFRSFY